MENLEPLGNFFWNNLHPQGLLSQKLSTKYYYNYFLLVLNELATNSKCQCTLNGIFIFTCLLNIESDIEDLQELKDPTKAKNYMENCETKMEQFNNTGLFFKILHNYVNLKLNKPCVVFV